MATSDRLFPTLEIDDTPESSDVPGPWEHVWRTFAGIVAEFPIEIVERAVSIQPALAHRARTSYDMLQAFVRRNDPAQAQRVRVIGHAYAMGRLTLQEVAHILGVSETDAVFELEAAGYARTIETIQACARAVSDQVLEQVAADIASRHGAVAPVDPDRVRP